MGFFSPNNPFLFGVPQGFEGVPIGSRAGSIATSAGRNLMPILAGGRAGTTMAPLIGAAEMFGPLSAGFAGGFAGAAALNGGATMQDYTNSLRQDTLNPKAVAAYIANIPPTVTKRDDMVQMGDALTPRNMEGAVNAIRDVFKRANANPGQYTQMVEGLTKSLEEQGWAKPHIVAAYRAAGVLGGLRNSQIGRWMGQDVSKRIGGVDPRQAAYQNLISGAVDQMAAPSLGTAHLANFVGESDPFQYLGMPQGPSFWDSQAGGRQ